jgi:hypothetical protein
MMEHAARNRTPALSATISRLEEASGHWLISSANRMLCHVCGMDCHKEASQYLSFILHKNSLLLVLECLLSTPCLHLRSLHVASKATDLENVCFLEAVLPDNFGPTLPVWQPQPSSASFIYRQLIYQYIYDLPFVWNETGAHSWTKVYLLFERDLLKCTYNNIESRVYNTLCEGIILQKRFVKKSIWIFRNLEKKCIT